MKIEDNRSNVRTFSDLMKGELRNERAESDNTGRSNRIS